jgi:hypothetical protein
MDRTNGGIQGRVLRCCDGDKDFTFQAGEQRFYWSKGLANPKRCKPCRDWRRPTLASGGWHQ